MNADSEIAQIPLPIVRLITPANFSAGTGLGPMLNNATQVFGDLPPDVVSLAISQLAGLFGDFPSTNDKAPAIVFCVLFAIIAFAHLHIYLRNLYHHHKFRLSIGLTLYCVFKCIGFGLRYQWAKDVRQVKVALAASVFTQVPVLFLNVMTMFMAHRIFTWRHPETGRSWWFIGFNITLYLFIGGVVCMAILGLGLPFLYYMGDTHYWMCTNVSRAAGVLEMLYAFSANGVLLLAWSIKPGTIDHRLWGVPPKTHDDYPATLQPYWIKHFRPLYYVTKGDQKTAARHVLPVMPSREKPAEGLSRPQNPPCDHFPSIWSAVYMVIITSAVLTICAGFRVATVFIVKPRGGMGIAYGHFAYRNTAFYILYGGVEYAINVMILLMRVDLRFYIPNASSKDARAIIDSGEDEFMIAEDSRRQSMDPKYAGRQEYPGEFTTVGHDAAGREIKEKTSTDRTEIMPNISNSKSADPFVTQVDHKGFLIPQEEKTVS